MPDNSHATGVNPARSRLGRWLLTAIGVLAVILAAIGMVLPGLPTTIFLILALFCFARACPPLERWLLNNRLFAPYVRIACGDQPMTARQRATTMMLIAGFSGLSCYLLHRAGQPQWTVLLVGILAVIGVVFVYRYRRAPITPPHRSLVNQESS
ncbi:MAG: hypothetical protein HJJLKODD_00801 [Phycisphaerae bacterium]|nr:hypothetical protein [Phycisphaerae bacterium]